MDVCLLWVLCVVRWRSLRRADHSSRGVLPTVVRRCVWSRNLKNEEAMDRIGPQRQRGKKMTSECRSQWSRVVRSRSAVTRPLRFWVRIPPGAWISVCCDCCVLSGRGLCDGQITRPEESYWPWCVAVCDLEASCMRGPWPVGAVEAKEKRQMTSN